MLILDTNVISEPMKPRPDPKVIGWLNAQSSPSLWLTTITVFEVYLGIERLAAGKKQRNLRDSFERSLNEDFDGRVLTFDVLAATSAARLSGKLHHRGLAIDIRDVQIAGITDARNATLVTRNLKDFRHTGIQLIDPWNMNSA